VLLLHVWFFDTSSLPDKMVYSFIRTTTVENLHQDAYGTGDPSNTMQRPPQSGFGLRICKLARFAVSQDLG